MAPASGDCDACYCSISDFSILDSVTIVPTRLEYIPTSQSKYFAPCVPDFVVDSPRVFEGDWRRPATPSTVRRALHAALRTTLRTAARRNFCFSHHPPNFYKIHPKLLTLCALPISITSCFPPISITSCSPDCVSFWVLTSSPLFQGKFGFVKKEVSEITSSDLR